MHRKKLERKSIFNKAEVVELVDTLGSGSSAGNGMGVRVSPSAPTRKKSPQSVKFCGLLFLCSLALIDLVVVDFVSHISAGSSAIFLSDRIFRNWEKSFAFMFPFFPILPTERKNAYSPMTLWPKIYESHGSLLV